MACLCCSHGALEVAQPKYLRLKSMYEATWDRKDTQGVRSEGSQ